MELIFIVALTLLLVPVVVLTAGWFRIVLGLLFLLFFPGYALLAAIFPKKDSLDPIERVALSFASSIAIIPLIGLVLNYTPLGITVYTVTASIAGLVVAVSAVAIWQRRRLPTEERFQVLPRISLSVWYDLSHLEKLLSVVLVASILVASGALIYLVAFPKLGEEFTEFYMPTGRDYPSELAVGEPLAVALRIVNHEHESISYHVEVRVDGEKVQQTEPFSLYHDETRDETVTIVFTEGGPQREIEFLLYKSGVTDPYRSLYLSMDVVQVQS